MVTNFLVCKTLTYVSLHLRRKYFLSSSLQPVSPLFVKTPSSLWLCGSANCCGFPALPQSTLAHKKMLGYPRHTVTETGVPHFFFPVVKHKLKKDCETVQTILSVYLSLFSSSLCHLLLKSKAQMCLSGLTECPCFLSYPISCSYFTVIPATFLVTSKEMQN